MKTFWQIKNLLWCARSEEFEPIRRQLSLYLIKLDSGTQIIQTQKCFAFCVQVWSRDWPNGFSIHKRIEREVKHVRLPTNQQTNLLSYTGSQFFTTKNDWRSVGLVINGAGLSMSGLQSRRFVKNRKLRINELTKERLASAHRPGWKCAKFCFFQFLSNFFAFFVVLCKCVCKWTVKAHKSTKP